MLRRIGKALREEFANLRPRQRLIELLLGLLPISAGGRIRSILLRLAGFRIGRGTCFNGVPRIVGNGPIEQRLSIGSGCWFNFGCSFELGAAIEIHDRVTFGPETMILTTTHVLGPPEHRCAERLLQPVVIENGVWIGARCTILPGVRIGAGAVVAAGALVNRDVAPNTLVAGVPARLVKSLVESQSALAGDYRLVSKHHQAVVSADTATH